MHIPSGRVIMRLLFVTFINKCFSINIILIYLLQWKPQHNQNETSSKSRYKKRKFTEVNKSNRKNNLDGKNVKKRNKKLYYQVIVFHHYKMSYITQQLVMCGPGWTSWLSTKIIIILGDIRKAKYWCIWPWTFNPIQSTYSTKKALKEVWISQHSGFYI